MLGRAVDEARRSAGGAFVDQLVLTHPAQWGGVRARVLRQAANGLAERITLVPEPVAAAVFHAATFVGDEASGSLGPADETLAVLDLGGGTVDVSVGPQAVSTGPRFAASAWPGFPHPRNQGRSLVWRR